jgi:hypothetical protein
MSAREMELVKAAYDALLARVAAGEIAKTDPVEILRGLDTAWELTSSANRLAIGLLDYAREQIGELGTSAGREELWRERLYAITQQLYERMRLSALGTTQGPFAA